MIAYRIFRCGDSACGLEADFPAGLIVESLDALAHYIGGHRCGVHAHLACGSLDEVRAFFHGKERGVGNVFRSDQKTCLQNHLQCDFSAGFRGSLVNGRPDCTDFFPCGLLVTGHKGVKSQDNVDLVSAGLHSHLTFLDLHLDETLGCREAASHSGDMNLMAGETLPYNGGEIREHTDRSRKRVFREILHEGIDLAYQFLHGRWGILCTEGRQIHE